VSCYLVNIFGLYASRAEVEQTGASSQFYDKFSRCQIYDVNFCNSLLYIRCKVNTSVHSHSFDSLTALHRRNISYILKVVWNNPVHREALNIEARYVF
jgi:hypothetical protein